MAERLQRLLGEGRTVRVVFDRGGYDQKVFGQLGRMGIEYAVCRRQSLAWIRLAS